MSKSVYSVYVLIKNKRPIYVGCTSNLNNRLNSHRELKDFDTYIVIKKYNSRKDALIAENSIIRYLSFFGDGTLQNEMFSSLNHIGFYKGLSDGGCNE